MDGRAYAMRRIGTRLGFTLVEMLIVLAIAGVVVRFAAPTLLQARSRWRYEKCITNLKLIELAKVKLVKQKKYPKTRVIHDAKDLVPTYLKSWPTGPIDGEYSAETVGTGATFRGHTSGWYVKHCGNDHYDGDCPL